MVQAPLPCPPHPSLQRVERRSEGEGFSPQILVLALLASLLVQPAEIESPIIRDMSSRGTLAVDGGGARVGTAQYRPGVLDLEARRRADLAAVVVDDESPFVGLFQELGLLERVCDADWVRFEHDAHRNSNGSSGRASAAMVDRDESIGVVGGGNIELPLAALVMQP